MPIPPPPANVRVDAIAAGNCCAFGLEYFMRCLDPDSLVLVNLRTGEIRRLAQSTLVMPVALEVCVRT